SLKILSWNCRGLGNSQTVQRLGEIHKLFSQDITFLTETKNSNDFVLCKCTSLDYPNSYLVPPTGHGAGGLALFWKQGLQIFYENKRFFATFIHADTNYVVRRQLWNELTALTLSRDAPWFVTGDFNDILNNQEKEGGRSRAEGSFVDFRSFMSECDLYDLPHTGDFLSWRGVWTEGVVRCRLDRAIANSHWFDIFHSGSVEYLKYEGSDHKPILTCFDLTRKKRKGLFRFDRRLKDNPEIQTLVDQTWKEAGTKSVQDKIALVRTAIIRWSKDQQRNSKVLIKKWKDELEQAMTKTSNDEALLNRINSDLKAAYLAEESFWKQRSRNLWLSLGDKNSGYFHAVTKGRRAKNILSVIENTEGTPMFTEKEITETIVDYFKSLFISVPGDRKQIVAEALTSKISPESNQQLINIPSGSEIHLALLAIHPDKAPGPDGFSAMC
ncbi:hypothetical protein N665_0668s0027, partial [Sinapis alba]